MLKKVIIWGIVIFVIYYLVADPHGAGGVVHSAINGLKDLAISFNGFVASL